MRSAVNFFATTALAFCLFCFDILFSRKDCPRKSEPLLIHTEGIQIWISWDIVVNLMLRFLVACFISPELSQPTNPAGGFTLQTGDYQYIKIFCIKQRHVVAVSMPRSDWAYQMPHLRPIVMRHPYTFDTWQLPCAYELHGRLLLKVCDEGSCFVSKLVSYRILECQERAGCTSGVRLSL